MCLVAMSNAVALADSAGAPIGARPVIVPLAAAMPTPGPSASSAPSTTSGTVSVEPETVPAPDPQDVASPQIPQTPAGEPSVGWASGSNARRTRYSVSCTHASSLDASRPSPARPQPVPHPSPANPRRNPMKRLHVHVSVEDLATSIQFYSTLFAAEASSSFSASTTLPSTASDCMASDSV